MKYSRAYWQLYALATSKTSAYKSTEFNYRCCCYYYYNYCYTYARVDKVFVLLTPFCGRHYAPELCLINTTQQFKNTNKIKGNNNQQHTQRMTKKQKHLAQTAAEPVVGCSDCRLASD